MQNVSSITSLSDFMRVVSDAKARTSIAAAQQPAHALKAGPASRSAVASQTQPSTTTIPRMSDSSNSTIYTRTMPAQSHRVLGSQFDAYA